MKNLILSLLVAVSLTTLISAKEVKQAPWPFGGLAKTTEGVARTATFQAGDNNYYENSDYNELRNAPWPIGGITETVEGALSVGTLGLSDYNDHDHYFGE